MKGVLRTPWLWFGAALGVALLICGWQALLTARFYAPAPSVSTRVGVARTVGGVSYRVDRFDVAPSFPPAKASGEPYAAPAGAQVVRIVLTEEVVDPGRDLTTLFCTPTVGVPDGREWSLASAYQLFDTEAPTCGGSSDEPARLNTPFEVGFAFVVPDDVAGLVSLRLELSTERSAIEFVR